MKACVVCVSAMKIEARSLAASLRQGGLEVCEEVVDVVTAAALTEGHGTVPQQVLDCIQSADVCYFLLEGGTEIAPSFGECLRFAATLGKKIVAIVEGQLPSIVDDVADTVLVPGSKMAVASAMGDVSSDHPARTAGPREIERVKCQ
jgi:hypothetical protein